MEISDWIKDCCTGERLIPVVPQIPVPIVRQVYVSKGVHEMLSIANTDPGREAERMSMVSLLDGFTEGRYVSVSNNGKNRPRHMMAKLDTEKDEVWEFRSTSPKPGLRLLGCFALKDVFVGLALERRILLDSLGSRPWRDIIWETETHWRNIFCTLNALKGSYPDEYITNYILE